METCCKHTTLTYSDIQHIQSSIISHLDMCPGHLTTVHPGATLLFALFLVSTNYKGKYLSPLSDLLTLFVDLWLLDDNVFSPQKTAASKHNALSRVASLKPNSSVNFNLRVYSFCLYDVITTFVFRNATSRHVGPNVFFQGQSQRSWKEKREQ